MRYCGAYLRDGDDLTTDEQASKHTTWAFRVEHSLGYFFSSSLLVTAWVAFVQSGVAGQIP